MSVGGGNTFSSEKLCCQINGSTRQIKLTGLSPYTWYKVSVRAVTVFKGSSRKIQETITVKFRTSDEAPTAPFNCDIKKRNSTSILVSWNTPYPFDYKVEFYKVKVNYALNRDVTAQSLTVYDQSVQLRKLRRYTMYHITVVAVTNNTRILEGPPRYLQTRTTLPGTSIQNSWRNSTFD
ncbi:tyrosine-protein phosphatase 99A-like [Corticium candelabrum]|uniref:tyrosine-protein phosphatase 99A-like n=1 Tax=Corticium candelabrum TaxID=121492 RepID=UPI002E26AED3|nr:tyrosine-protein phosphatase 99A-like [Corticium candelabrum]